MLYTATVVTADPPTSVTADTVAGISNRVRALLLEHHRHHGRSWIEVHITDEAGHLYPVGTTLTEDSFTADLGGVDEMLYDTRSTMYDELFPTATHYHERGIAAGGLTVMSAGSPRGPGQAGTTH